ncbi:nucleotide exchange factor GrpE [Streptomyces lomondensis]|uniref:Protein GrpE n=1 Tax=Streptomyces lomondensis TaxID=68229 RepID=A0ABQ2X590_9ACTN|nr:nucleotide exchange factor GrpE [Streptomyces lomondensis]MCF0078106.1 nucleotide exchange factor GrpE [Streptomyces lomondensis]GGX00435.1 hypothetical protein GCM10010383_33000 [Streptomyces lomondensis]
MAQEHPDLRQLLQERTADLQRVKAEYDNYRKQVRRDRMAVRHIAVANVLTALLPVLDAVEQACAQEAMTPGLKEISDTLHTQVGSLGLQAFGEEGEPFDPECHEALQHHVVPDAERLVCTQILRCGYRLGDRLLRPAHVVVTGPPPSSAGTVQHGRARPGVLGGGGEGPRPLP